MLVGALRPGLHERLGIRAGRFSYRPNAVSRRNMLCE